MRRKSQTWCQGHTTAWSADRVDTGSRCCTGRCRSPGRRSKPRQWGRGIAAQRRTGWNWNLLGTHTHTHKHQLGGNSFGSNTYTAKHETSQSHNMLDYRNTQLWKKKTVKKYLAAWVRQTPPPHTHTHTHTHAPPPTTKFIYSSRVSARNDTTGNILNECLRAAKVTLP